MAETVLGFGHFAFLRVADAEGEFGDRVAGGSVIVTKSKRYKGVRAGLVVRGR